MTLQPGTHRLVRVDGTEETLQGKATLRQIYKLIHCEAVDSVTIQKRPRLVMIVDDNGMVDEKPVNGRATILMVAANPGYPYSIHGDVVIAYDRDFA